MASMWSAHPSLFHRRPIMKPINRPRLSSWDTLSPSFTAMTSRLMTNLQHRSINMLPFKIAIITSRFNEEITGLLKQGALERFHERGDPIADQDIFMVPGAIEIPVVAGALARKGG